MQKENFTIMACPENKIRELLISSRDMETYGASYYLKQVDPFFRLKTKNVDNKTDQVRRTTHADNKNMCSTEEDL